MGALKINLEVSGSAVIYKLEGVMDDAADYSPIIKSKSKIIAVDFLAVKQINSLGIQKWIGAIDQIPEGVRIIFQNCTIKIVNQMNLFPRFMGLKGATVKSFEIPYFCEACDTSSVLTVETAKEFKNGALKVPERKCSSCQDALEFDGVEKKYFSFLNMK